MSTTIENIEKIYVELAQDALTTLRECSPTMTDPKKINNLFKAVSLATEIAHPDSEISEESRKALIAIRVEASHINTKASSFHGGQIKQALLEIDDTQLMAILAISHMALDDLNTLHKVSATTGIPADQLNTYVVMLGNLIISGQ